MKKERQYVLFKALRDVDKGFFSNKILQLYKFYNEHFKSPFPQKNLKDKVNWPNGYSSAVVLRFNADFSEGGMKNLRRLLNKHGVKCTLAIKMEDLNPKFIKASKELGKEGNELALHGYHHRMLLPFLSSSQKMEEIKRSVYAFRRVFKENPMGFFSSSDMWDEESIRIVSKYVKYIANENLLFPRRGKTYDITSPHIDDKTDENLGEKWDRVMNFITENGGIFTTCWHVACIKDERLPLYDRVLSSLGRSKVWITTGREVVKYLGEVDES